MAKFFNGEIVRRKGGVMFYRIEREMRENEAQMMGHVGYVATSLNDNIHPLSTYYRENHFVHVERDPKGTI